MAEFKDIIKKLRSEKNMSQAELASELEISNSSVAMWEIGRRYPSKDLYEQLADLFNVDIDYLYGRTSLRQKVHYDNDGNAMFHQSGKIINVLGRVAADVPIEAVENIIDTEEISEEMAKTGEFFGLQIKGDSMEPRIYEGDVVIVRKQEDAESGDIVIALVNGNDATCKRLTKYAGGISLVSLNSAKYEPMMFSQEEIETKPVKIIGKVIELRGKL